jgi:hypothetical protein
VSIELGGEAKLTVSLGFKEIMGILSVAIALLAYVIYFAQTLTGFIRPHPLSWLVFGVLTGTGYLIQINQGEQAGSWVMLCTAVCCFGLCLVSVKLGERRFPLHEWAFLFGAGIVFFLYLCSRNPKLLALVVSEDVVRDYGADISAIAATIVDVLGYGPTVSKVLERPYSDSMTNYFLNSCKFWPSLAAMEAITIPTSVYPGTLIVVNLMVFGLIWYLRYQLNEGGGATPNLTKELPVDRGGRKGRFPLC